MRIYSTYIPFVWSSYKKTTQNASCRQNVKPWNYSTGLHVYDKQMIATLNHLGD